MKWYIPELYKDYRTYVRHMIGRYRWSNEHTLTCDREKQGTTTSYEVDVVDFLDVALSNRLGTAGLSIIEYARQALVAC